MFTNTRRCVACKYGIFLPLPLIIYLWVYFKITWYWYLPALNVVLGARLWPVVSWSRSYSKSFIMYGFWILKFINTRWCVTCKTDAKCQCQGRIQGHSLCMQISCLSLYFLIYVYMYFAITWYWCSPSKTICCAHDHGL